MPSAGTPPPARSVFRPDREIRQADWLVALGATAVAVWLHTTFVTEAGALWRDEVNTIAIASAASLGEVWRLLEFESYPILWPLLVRGWMALFGASDTALRVMGLLGGLAVPAAAWFAARQFGRPLPLLSIAFLAVNPTVLVWGSSVRAWGLGTALAILTVALVWRACESPSCGRIVGAAVAATLSVQCLYQNALLFAAMAAAAALVGALQRRRMFMLVPVAVGAFAAASLVPYAQTLARAGSWAPLNVVDITGLNVFARLLMAHSPTSPLVLTVWLGVLAAAGIWGVRLTLAAPEPWPAPAWRRWAFAMLLLLLAPVVMVPFYAAVDYPANPWYFICLVGTTAVLTDAAIPSLPDGFIPRAAPAAAIVVLVLGLAPAWRAVQQPLSNMDGIAQELAVGAQPFDLVVASPWLYGISLRRYVRPDLELMTIPPLADYRVHRFDLLKARMTSDTPIEKLLEMTRSTLQSGRRVWIVGDLPPAGATTARPGAPPLPGSEWRVLPYVEAWTDELMLMLEVHAVDWAEVPVERIAQPLENARLAWFSGWQ